MKPKAALINTAPIGTITPFLGNIEPAGWMFCDGRPLPTTGTYADLFAVLQYTYGGSGASFNILDARGRALVAKDGLGSSSTTSRLSSGGTLGQSGGAETAATTLPAHQHSQSASHSHPAWSSTHSHTVADLLGYGSGLHAFNYGGADPSHTIHLDALSGSDVSTNGVYNNTAPALNNAAASLSLGQAVDPSGSTAAGGANHPNMMPWIALPYIIKYSN